MNRFHDLFEHMLANMSYTLILYQFVLTIDPLHVCVLAALFLLNLIIDVFSLRSTNLDAWAIFLLGESKCLVGKSTIKRSPCLRTSSSQRRFVFRDTELKETGTGLEYDLIRL